MTGLLSFLFWLYRKGSITTPNPAPPTQGSWRHEGAWFQGLFLLWCLYEHTNAVHRQHCARPGKKKKAGIGEWVVWVSPCGQHHHVWCTWNRIAAPLVSVRAAEEGGGSESVSVRKRHVGYLFIISFKGYALVRHTGYFTHQRFHCLFLHPSR